MLICPDKSHTFVIKSPQFHLHLEARRVDSASALSLYGFQTPVSTLACDACAVAVFRGTKDARSTHRPLARQLPLSVVPCSSSVRRRDFRDGCSGLLTFGSAG